MANTYKNASAAPGATSEATLYTCPSATTALVNVRVANVHATDSDTIILTRRDDSAAADYKLCNLILVPIKSVFEMHQIVLEAGDLLKYTPGAASKLHLTADILEIT